MTKSWLVGATALMALGGTAYAMGSYTAFTLVAWSEDGASALLTEWHASSAEAGSSTTYVLVGAADKAPARFTFDNTLDPEHAKQSITVAVCGKGADALTTALASHHFKGVTVHKDKCSDATRAVVTTDAASARLAEMSWIARATSRPSSPREDAALKVVELAKAADERAANADVAATTGKLVLVCFLQSGDNSGPKVCFAYAGDKKIAEL